MKRLLIALMLVFVCGIGHSAGVVTITYSEVNTVKSVVFSWVSDATGDSTGTTKVLSGQILRLIANPSESATPTDNYDVVITDEDGLDITAGLGTNLDETVETQTVPCVTNGTAGNMAPIAFNSTLTCTVSAAGDTKAGTITILYR